jgi:hypothetical protein
MRSRVKAQILLGIFLVGATCAFPQGGIRSGFPAMRAGEPRHFFPGAFPWFAGDYGYGYGSYGYEGYAPGPSVVIVQQPPFYVLQPPAPSVPPQPEIHEYQQPAAASAPKTVDERVFAIVLKDGTVHSAAAVTVQRNALYYVEPDGGHRLVSLDALDREATGRLNRERKLRLQLPPAQ